MDSKQILLLPFLALLLVLVDGQNTSRELSETESLILALRDNLCVNVPYINDTECLHKAVQELTFSIEFISGVSTNKCNKFANRLSRRQKIKVEARRCEASSKRFRAVMFVDQLQWVCNNTELAKTKRIKVKEEREPGLKLCAVVITSGGTPGLPLCSEINQPCIPGLNICRCDIPLPDCSPTQLGCTPGKVLENIGCKCAATPQPPFTRPPTTRPPTTRPPTTRPPTTRPTDKNDDDGGKDEQK